MAYLECAEGVGVEGLRTKVPQRFRTQDQSRGSGTGMDSPETSFFVNEYLNFDVLEEKN